MMKKRTMILTAVMAAAAILLTGCMSTNTTKEPTGAGVAVSDSQKSAGSGEDAGASQDAGAPQDAQGNVEGTQDAQGDAGASQDSQEVDVQTTYDMENQAGDAPVQASAGQDTEETTWDGTYVSDSKETLTIQAEGDEIYFGFSISGISGKAAVDGEQAVYHGDDDYQVTFSYYGGSIEVLAGTGDEAEDAEPSAIDGIYLRQ